MADAKQILVVDDHFEMLEFLRSMLELSNQDCEVLAVPSAEEGLLELRRAQFDLLITDVRLPGMSGFDLVRRVKTLGREMPVIMITAYSSNQGRKEASDLGVYRYFQKPLDTDSVLTAVHTALHGESVSLPPATSVMAVPATAVPDELQRRLDSLRVDTGAMHLTLASTKGEILFSAGDGRQFNLQKLMNIVADNLGNSFLLADELGATEPFTLQYHMGDDFEFYCANVGRGHFLSLFFDIAARRGRIGTIWVFTQRAIKDLQQMLTVLPQAPAVVPEVVQLPVLEEEEVVLPETAVFPPVTADPAFSPPEETSTPADYLDIAPDELMDLLSGEDKDRKETAELDAFWDTSTTDEDENSRGISMEEALQRGLIDFDNQSD